MINNKKITALAKQIKRHKDGLDKSSIMNPTRDWFIGLVIGVVFLSGAGMWSAQLYLVFKKDLVIEPLPEVRPEVYRKSQVKAVLDEFSERQKVHESLLQAKVKQVEVPISPTETATTTEVSSDVEDDSVTSSQEFFEGNDTENLAPVIDSTAEVEGGA